MFEKKNQLDANVAQAIEAEKKRADTTEKVGRELQENVLQQKKGFEQQNHQINQLQ
jgi:hypothetical protein